MDGTVLGAMVTGAFGLAITALGLLSTGRARRAESAAAQRSADLDTLRAVIAELRLELAREREDYDREAARLRARIRELESS